MSSNHPNLKSDNDIERIAAVLNPRALFNEDEGEFEVDSVSYDSLEKYEEFLQKKIATNTELTGRESLGCFSWEERFEFQGGVGSQEYLDLKKSMPSCRDIFSFISFEDIDEVVGILVKVKRKEDKKIFTLPLADLENAGKSTDNSINDYAVWMVNYQ
jgi:hypothetical protein